MKSFGARRWRNFVLLGVACALLITANSLLGQSLHRTTAFSGWTLLGALAFLAGYNVRKRLPFLPLGSSAAWMQLHIYLGLASGLVFLLHIAWRFPSGVFEAILALAYLLVFASGIFGLWASRVFPRRLTTRGREVLYERIPRVRGRIRRAAERDVVACLEATESTAIPEFYSARLQDFFSAPRNFFAHLFQSQRSRRDLLDGMDAQRRYLNEMEHATMNRLGDYVAAKDDLDFHHAHHKVLKFWLFVHVPLTYALLALAAFHVLFVYAYSGGLR